MTRRPLLVSIAAALLLTPSLLRAQIASVYATVSIPHASGVQTGAVYSASTTSYTEASTSFTTAGFGGGVTFNFLPLPVVKLGLDLRGSSKPGTVGADTALAGIRLSVAPPLLKFHPYIQGSVGYLGTRTTNLSTSPTSTQAVGGTFNNKYAVYEVLGGIDYPLVHFVDFRLIEVGAGHSFMDGSTTGVSLVTVNTGLVVHF